MLLPLLMNATNMLGFRSTGGGGDYGTGNRKRKRKPTLERKVLPLEDVVAASLGIVSGEVEAEPAEIEAAEKIQAIAAKHSELSHPDDVKQINFAAFKGAEEDRLEAERLILEIEVETIERARDENAIAVLLMLQLI